MIMYLLTVFCRHLYQLWFILYVSKYPVFVEPVNLVSPDKGGMSGF